MFKLNYNSKTKYSWVYNRYKHVSLQDILTPCQDAQPDI